VNLELLARVPVRMPELGIVAAVFVPRVLKPF
jgi:hypothetical protein